MPFKEYKNEYENLRFTYPKEFTVDCCELPKPTTKSQIIISMGIKESNDKYGVIGIYNEPNFQTEKSDYTFDEFVQRQKEILISDYKIVNNGKEPAIIEEQTIVGGKFAVRFKGLSWKGNDIIFINQYRGDRNNNYYSISIMNKMGSSFEETLKSIMDSISFAKMR